MNPAVDLQNLFSRGIFTVRDLNNYEISAYQLKQLLNEGKIERLGRGVYRSIGSDIAEEEWFKLGTLWIGQPSAICLLSALAYYHLTDEIPKQTWVMVPHAKLSRHKSLRLIRVRTPRWDLGVEKKDGFWITSVTRTIVDVFVHPQIIGSPIAIESLRRAVDERLTSLRAVYEMAIKLRVGHRILPYVELLS